MSCPRSFTILFTSPGAMPPIPVSEAIRQFPRHPRHRCWSPEQAESECFDPTCITTMKFDSDPNFP